MSSGAHVSGPHAAFSSSVQLDQGDGIHERKLPTRPWSLSATDQLVHHDLEPHFLAASHLVQTLQPLTLLNQIAITHPAPDVLHRVPTSRSETVEPEYPRETSPQADRPGSSEAGMAVPDGVDSSLDCFG